MKIDEDGVIMPKNTMQLVDKVPAIFLDLQEVATYHTDPMKLVEKIGAQMGYIVHDVSTRKGRELCNKEYNQAIRCISLVCNESKRLASEAKKIVNQDVNFRKLIDPAIREVAAYHRKPLTELEEREAAQLEADRAFEQKMENQRLYLLDWDDAIAFDELFTLRQEKALRDAEAEALIHAREQEEYEKRLQAEAIIKERERHAQEIEQLKKKQEAEMVRQEAEAFDTECLENLDNGLAEPVTINLTEYVILKGASDKLYKIIELWFQAKRMFESAERCDNSSQRNKELWAAQKVRSEAIALIENVG